MNKNLTIYILNIFLNQALHVCIFTVSEKLKFRFSVLA